MTAGATLAGLALALALPPLADGLPLAGQRALAVTLAAIVLWTTEALEPGVTALLSVALLALTGSGMRGALQGFASPVPYFLVGVLTMGVAVVRSGLAERLARAILARARGRSLAVYLHLVLAFPALTFVLPSATTRSGILIHIYDEVFTLAAVPRGAEIARAVMLALSSINRLASTALFDRRDHAGDERGHHRRARGRRHAVHVEWVVRAHGAAVLHDPRPRRCPDIRAVPAGLPR